MSNNVLDKLSALENLLKEKDAKLNKKATLTATIYIVLVLLTAAYTLIIVPYIKQLTSPDAASELAMGWASQYLTDGRLYVSEQLRENSGELATTIVQQTIEVIPKAEGPLVGMIDDMIDYVVSQIEYVMIPAFTASLKENAAELKDRYAEFQDEEKMQGLALVFVEILEDEMDKYVNENFNSEIFELKKKLATFTELDADLTKKELAQRRALLNWIYLTEHQDVAGSAFYDLVERVKTEITDLFELEKNASELPGVGLSNVDEL